nr:MAG TPA: hypothetical protein [Caudoviricetes sp.]
MLVRKQLHDTLPYRLDKTSLQYQRTYCLE